MECGDSLAGRRAAAVGVRRALLPASPRARLRCTAETEERRAASARAPAVHEPRATGIKRHLLPAATGPWIHSVLAERPPLRAAPSLGVVPDAPSRVGLVSESPPPHLTMYLAHEDDWQQNPCGFGRPIRLVRVITELHTKMPPIARPVPVRRGCHGRGGSCRHRCSRSRRLRGGVGGGGGGGDCGLAPAHIWREVGLRR